MNKKFILVSLIGLAFYLTLSSYSTGPGRTGGLERTGASGGTVGCGTGGCHAPSATASTTVSIQLISGGSPVTSYTGGSAYTIRVTGTNTGGSSLPAFGFQLAAMKTGSTTVNAGTLSAIASTHTVTVSGINLVEHSSPLTHTTGTGGSGTTYVVNIPWTAPVAGTGSVTVFAVINAVNDLGTADAGDLWNNATLAIPETVPSVSPITGTLSVCMGATTPLADVTPAGTWSSSAPGTASVGASTGIVTGGIAGTATITYTTGTGSATAVVTVNPLPAAIGGTMSTCTGGSATLTDGTSGGTWTSGTTSVATIGTTSGSVAGVTAGTSLISYTLTATGCRETATVTVTAVTAITGLDTVCTGATIPLADVTAGGTWSSHTPATATVSASGVVTGVAYGADAISYTLPGGCIASRTIQVESEPGTIAGRDTVCIGSTITLTENVPGGAWTSANAHATVGTSGVVTGAALGTDTIKYAVTNVCGSGTATHVILVRAAGTCNTGFAQVGITSTSLNIFPNPTHGQLDIVLSSATDEEITIVATNMVGAKVATVAGRTNSTISLNLNAAPGVYLVSATTAEGRYVSKVVVE